MKISKYFKFLKYITLIVLLITKYDYVYTKEIISKANKLTISAIKNEQTHELAKEIIRTAYKRIGVNIEFDELPARRALEWANSGKTDGDLARIDGTEKKFSNLIKISTPIIEFKGVVYTKKVKKDIRSWEDLRGLSVGIIGGIRYSDIGTEGLDRVSAKDMTHLFKLLSKDHIDVAIAVLEAGRVEIHKNYKNSKIHVIGQPIYSAYLYHFIHQKNKDIIPQLESILSGMKKNGELETIRENSLNEILKK